jgi:outer membrane immunogenic protein
MKLRFVSARAATFIIAGLVAGSAMAADAVDEVPAAPAAEIAPVFTWTGFYAGLGGGPTWANGDFDVFSEDMNGGLITGFVGYNWQLDNNFVFGIEGDVSYNWDKADVGPFEVGLETAGSVRARLGYAIDRALIYGAAGWTGAQAHIDGPAGDDSDTLSGWTIGAGVDYAFTKNVFGRLEYRYNDYGSADLLGLDGDIDQHVVMIGVGYKF